MTDDRPPRRGARASGRTAPPPPLVVPLYYDFASTICYVAHRVMERMAADVTALGVALEWRPLDLVAITGWPRDTAVAGPRRANALRVARDLRVPVHVPARWLDSRAAHAVAVRLGATPKAAAWRERVWTAVFEEGLAIDDAAVVARLGADLGLDVGALDVPARAALAAATTAARRAGVTGVPTFMLDEWPFGGIQEEATMRSLLERFARKRARARRP